MAHGPDWSDSEDSLFDDDGDYDNFKTKIKSYNNPHDIKPPELTEKQKRQLDLNLFYNAVSSGNIESVTEFLNKGLDANLNLRDGWTPLLLSASYGNYDLTKLLIEYEADVNQDRDGVTALMMACSCPDYTSPFESSLAVIQLLVEKGADVQAINRKRMDALMHAACIGNLPAVKYLLPKANKQAVDNQRWSALTWAVSSNQIEVFKYLIDKGFDIHITDVRGNKPFDIAKDGGFEEMVNLFPKKESDIVTDIIQTSKLEFEDHFSGLKNDAKPSFFRELCDILLAVNCRHLIPIFQEKNITLDQFLSMDNDDLMQIGIALPYQRNRILTGLHRFHKQPYHPKSLHICIKSNSYSNVDVATQIMSTIQQIIAMESSLKFILKTLEKGDLTKEEKEMAFRSIKNIKLKIKSCKMVVKKLDARFKEWDERIKPADQITKNSIGRFPWKKMSFCVGILGLIILCKLEK